MAAENISGKGGRAQDIGIVVPPPEGDKEGTGITWVFFPSPQIEGFDPGVMVPFSTATLKEARIRPDTPDAFTGTVALLAEVAMRPKGLDDIYPTHLRPVTHRDPDDF